MSTPICRTCDTKFPGKDKCKTCGSDPNAEPTLDWKIEQAKAKPKIKILDELNVLSVGPVLYPPREMEMIPLQKFTVKHIAKAFGVSTSLILDPKTLRKARSAQRARVRSLQNTKTSSRGNKHGRAGAR